jgi:hypothetical protein
VTPLPWFAGTLLLGLAYRYLTRRGGGRRIRLPDGRRLELLSAITLRSGPAWHLLALEYVSTLPSSDQEALRGEAHDVLRAAASWPEFAQCREATITVHLRGADRAAIARRAHVFGFHRPDTGTAWEPAPMSG